MQTKASLSVLAVAVALPMSVATGFAQIFDNVDSLKNRAVAASPRYLEAHPELLDVPPSAQETDARAARHREQLAKLTKNRALATSPRFLEDHPELLRPQPLVAEAEAKAARIRAQVAKLMENRALVASPRFQEEFPAVARSATPVSVEGGTAKPTELHR